MFVLLIDDRRPMRDLSSPGLDDEIAFAVERELLFSNKLDPDSRQIRARLHDEVVLEDALVPVPRLIDTLPHIDKSNAVERGNVCLPLRTVVADQVIALSFE